jgi:hypothetical protein
MSQLMNLTNNPITSAMFAVVMHRVYMFAIMLQIPNVIGDEGIELEVFNQSETEDKIEVLPLIIMTPLTD